MKLRKTIAGLFLATALVGCTDADAFTSISEFDSKTSKEKGELVEKTVFRILDHYTEEEPDYNKANCLMRLFDREENGDISQGIRLLGLEFNKARRMPNPEQYHIEGIILGVIDRECPSTPKP